MKLNVRSGETIYRVEIVDLSARPVQVLVEGTAFEIWPEEAPVLVENPPVLQAHTAQHAKPGSSSAPVLKAPIPGVITAVSVSTGDAVEHGQELCKLEAMKMSNTIRSNQNGRIKSILISVGQQVKQSDLLFEFMD